MNATAVLLSAGLDSAVLVAAEAKRSVVQPLYVTAGLAWEAAELGMLGRLLRAAPFHNVEPLVTLEFGMHDLYPATHWALRGHAPGFDTPDSDVYLAGRNISLLAKAAIYCAQHRIHRIVLGPLAGNSFPDATPDFFAAMTRALSLGLGHPLTVETPFLALRKADVIRLGHDLRVPFELTLSCMEPKDGRHCGCCSKCRERRDGFAAAGIADPTVYATTPQR